MRAAIYARYSPGESQREESAEAQIRMGREHAKRAGYTVVQVYRDEHLSGRTDQRPAFQQMLADAKAGAFDVLLVDKVDRFGRDRADSLVHKRMLRKKAGIRIEYTSQRIEDTPEGMLTEGILESLAEYFSLNLAAETMKGLKENAYKGWHCGGRPPFGLSLVPVAPESRSKRYVLNEPEARIVRRVFEIVDQGGTYADVREQTKADCILLRGRPLSKNSIHDILRNPKYKGEMLFNRGTKKEHRMLKDDAIRVPGALPAIVPPELWDRVNAKLNGRKHQEKGRMRGTRIYLLSGLVYCGKCGHAMVARCGYSKNKPRHDYYMCGLKVRSKECDAKTVRQDWVDTIVLRGLEEKIFAPGMRTRIVEHLEAALLEAQTQAGKRIMVLEKERRAAQQTIEHVVNAVAQGFISDALKKRLHAAEAKVAEVESEIAKARSGAVRRVDRGRLNEYLDAQYQALKTDIRAQKKVIQTFVREVRVLDDFVQVSYAVDNIDMLLVAPTGLEPVSPP